MAYELVISERADKLIDDLTGYILFKLNNAEAAGHFLDELESIYDRLAENPYQFHESLDNYLYGRGYREALSSHMNFRVVFRIENKTVFIVGVFHSREDFGRKVSS